jgi:hypothetical protein
MLLVDYPTITRYQPSNTKTTVGYLDIVLLSCTPNFYSQITQHDPAIEICKYHIAEIGRQDL